MDNCNRCANCFDLSWLGQYNKCPAYKARHFESYVARGKFNIARALVDGVLDYDQDLAERVFSCTECRACAEHCFKFLDTIQVFAAMKADLAARGLLPEGLAQALGGPDGLDRVHNVYHAAHRERMAWAPDPARIDRPAETVFYVGCTSAYGRQNMATDTVAILDLLGVDYALLSDEWCCGHPCLAAGEHDKARQVMEHNLALFQEMGARRVVFDCPGGLKVFRKDLPALPGRSLPWRPVHLLEDAVPADPQPAAQPPAGDGHHRPHRVPDAAAGVRVLRRGRPSPGRWRLCRPGGAKGGARERERCSIRQWLREPDHRQGESP